MKKIIVVVMFFALIIPGCTVNNPEQEQMTDSIHTLSVFTKVKMGMTYKEVIAYMGEPILIININRHHFAVFNLCIDDEK